jgi:hypothetical protein
MKFYIEKNDLKYVWTIPNEVHQGLRRQGVAVTFLTIRRGESWQIHNFIGIELLLLNYHERMYLRWKYLFGSSLLHWDTLHRLLSWKQVYRRYSVSDLYERNENTHNLDIFFIGKNIKFWVESKTYRVIKVDLGYTLGLRTLYGPSERWKWMLT